MGFPGQPLSGREVNIIKQMIDDKLTIQQIARRLKRPYSTVYSYVTRAGLSPFRVNVKIPDYIDKLYTNEKYTIRQIMRVTGASYGGVHAKLIRLGVKLRPRGGSYRDV